MQYGIYNQDLQNSWLDNNDFKQGYTKALEDMLSVLIPLVLSNKDIMETLKSMNRKLNILKNQYETEGVYDT